MSLGHNQPKQHHLYIFDLDDTLYLWKLGPAARAAYEAKLRPYLERLSHEGATLAVASFNRNACKLLTSMGIRPLFSQVICPQELRTGPRVADPGLEFDNEDKATLKRCERLGFLQQRFPHVEASLFLLVTTETHRLPGWNRSLGFKGVYDDEKQGQRPAHVGSQVGSQQRRNRHARTYVRTGACLLPWWGSADGAGTIGRWTWNAGLTPSAMRLSATLYLNGFAASLLHRGGMGSSCLATRQ
ncbi:hypothetical protein BDZ88DRAFT_210127 [Geranomyces variabilis]|nr:hypothetical protein BDZ88DRAFT_210127 [Geranomyces variabilis]